MQIFENFDNVKAGVESEIANHAHPFRVADLMPCASDEQSSTGLEASRMQQG